MDKLTIFLLSVFFVLPKTAHAYLDPGAGSYFIQILIGTVLGGAYLVKRFWKSITSFIANFLGKLLKKTE